MSTDFERRFVRESASIEGQTIPPGAVDTSLHMRAFREMISVADGERTTDGHAYGRSLTQGDLKNWQRLIGSEQHRWGDHALKDRSLGAYRRHHIEISGVGAVGSRWHEVPQDMDAIWTLVMADAPDPVEQAATVHHAFEWCHPFTDGNGRSGRLLALWLLRRHGAKPVLFTNADKREAYYPSFRTSDPSLMIDYFRGHQVDYW